MRDDSRITFNVGENDTEKPLEIQDLIDLFSHGW